MTLNSNLENQMTLELNRRDVLQAGLATAVTVAMPAMAQANFPSKPVKIVVPYAAGGPIDVSARLLADKVKDSLGSVIVDNKPGAGGNLGADLVAKASPDGMTIGIAAVATHAINPWLFKKMPYDPVHDFTPITGIAQVPNVLVMNAQTADKLGIRMPLVSGLYEIIFNGRSLYDVVLAMMLASQSSDVEFVLPKPGEE